MKQLMILTVLLLLVVGSASAQNRSGGFYGAGPRLGFTVNPDQFHFGGQIDFGDITPRLMMIPNLELGFGDNVTTIAPTFELDYRFRHDWEAWTPYLGGGVGPIFYSFDGGAGSVSKFGIYIEGGLVRQLNSNNGRFFIEAKLGFADAPDAKFTAGWMFGR